MTVKIKDGRGKETSNKPGKNPSRAFNLATICGIILAIFAFNSATFAQAQARGKRGVGAVFVLTNALASNGVAIFSREPDGELRARETVATGGQGTGGLLDAQGSLILSEGGEWLFAVNALSNEISVFEVVEDAGLVLVSKVPSGGERPISLTVSEDLLYVLNSGGAGNITAFRIGTNGGLSQIAGSSRPISTAATEPCPRPTDAGRTCNAAGPAQVQFSPGGDVLIVTERLTSLIVSYTVDDDGQAAQSSIFQGVADSTPFGFDFAERGRLIVSNAFLDLPGLAAASSYVVSATGTIDAFSFPPLGNGETASCWLTVTNNGRYAIITNPVADSLTSYTINDDGSLSLLNAQAGDLAGGDPRDLDLTDNGRFLYVLNNVTATVSSFRVEGDGTLVRLALNAGDGFPSGAVGLAAQ